MIPRCQTALPSAFLRLRCLSQRDGLVEVPWVSPVTCTLSASQGGVRDPAGGGRAPALVGGKAALPLQPQDAALPALPAGAHSALRAAAAADDGSALAAVP